MQFLHQTFASLLLIATSAASLTRINRDNMIKVIMNGKSHCIDEIIKRDVCIIGGGASGTYAALGLKDRNKTVVVIENQDSLGGHTNTYHDPATGATEDIGVIIFHDMPLVKRMFGRYNIPLIPFNILPNINSMNVDFRNGKQVDTSVTTTAAESAAAMSTYAMQLAKYPELNTGYNLKYPIASDLLLPFGKFVEKYSLQAAVIAISTVAQGYVDILSIPTLYILGQVGNATLRSLSEGFLTTARDNNGELYDRAFIELGDDVLLRHTVVETERNCPITNTSKLLVKDCAGRFKLIVAEKILFTAPPKLENMIGWDLDPTEQRIFSQFSNGGYYTALFRGSNLSPNATLSAAAAATPYHLPQFPGPYYIGPSVISGLHNVKYGSQTSLSQAVVKRGIEDSIKRLQVGVVGKQYDEVEWVFFKSHTPYNLEVSAENIKNGFYEELNGLQGRNGMWYTGAAFRTHDSSLLWEFTEVLIGRIIE